MNRTSLNPSIFDEPERVYIARCEFIEINYHVRPYVIPPLPPKKLSSHVFTGRTDYLLRLEEHFCTCAGGRRRFFLLYGERGIGKTQICLKFTEQYADFFSDIFWIDASSESSIELRLRQIAIAYNTSQEVRSSAESILQWISEGSGWLMVYDCGDGDPSVLEKYLPPGDEGSILVTSRNMGLQSIILNQNSMEVHQMKDEEAVSLFLKASMLDGTSDERNMARGIVSILGGIPLVLDKAGEFIQGCCCTIDDYMDLVQKHRNQLLSSDGASNPRILAIQGVDSIQEVENSGNLVIQSMV